MLSQRAGARIADPMTAEENHRVPPSTQVTPLDLNLSAPATGGQAAAAVSSNTARLQAGELLGGRYRIERELGEGGMGVVYLAADEQVPGERFAIKVLKEEVRPEALMLLREEVRKTRKLSHPTIVDVHSVNVDGQRLYVLMEYLEGKSLDKLLDEEFGRGMPFSHAWPIIEDVGAALANAHDHNVIHSDIKPANVFVTTSGRTKLLDFGIARVSRGPLLQARTGPRALTPGYASCEMLEGKEADRRDDIYSFACVIYEMLCGERPFGELSAREAREAGAKVQPLEKLSRSQNAALARALAFERPARSASVETLLAGLSAERPHRSRMALIGATVVAVLSAAGFTYAMLDRLWLSRHSVVVQSGAQESQPARAGAAPLTAAFSPPPHSIAVLPFVNMSGDNGQEYFSDGVSDELINALSHVEALQVCARTSSFAFKGKDLDIGTIARKLNVAVILEGSIRRSGNMVRITAQLVNAVSGFHMWSQNYDRDLSDILTLQTDIALAVAQEMQAKLLGDESARMEVGGTRNPAAYDAYLRGTQIAATAQDAWRPALAAFDQAIALDPNFAAARAQRARALRYEAFFSTDPTAVHELYTQAREEAERAVALAPDYADAHMVLGWHILVNAFMELGAAAREIDRAMALAPGSAAVLDGYAGFQGILGHHDAALVAMRRAIRLDPENSRYREHLLLSLIWARRFEDVLVAAPDARALNAESYYPGFYSALSNLVLGHLELARQACETPAPLAQVDRHVCLALVDHALGEKAQALTELRALQALQQDLGAANYAAIYAQWGDSAAALRWLAKAEREYRASLVTLKVDWMFDPIRSQPEFQSLERRLNFPP
jgi:serine/threonine-protein kinase